MTLMISGAARGLGRYLHEQLGGVAVTRETNLHSLEAPKQPYKAIVHCAFNMSRDVEDINLNCFLEDTIFLTRKLSKIPHEQFIFMSTIDVYPGNFDDCREDMTINSWSLDTPYKIFKLSCESIVRNLCSKFLILRPGLLLGPYMRPNNLTRLVNGQNGPISLSADSYFNCVLYEDILRLIQYSLENQIEGTFNTTRCGVVTMADLADKFKQQPKFGSFLYRPPLISNSKITALCPWFSGTSMEAVENLARAGK